MVSPYTYSPPAATELTNKTRFLAATSPYSNWGCFTPPSTLSSFASYTSSPLVTGTTPPVTTSAPASYLSNSYILPPPHSSWPTSPTRSYSTSLPSGQQRSYTSPPSVRPYAGHLPTYTSHVTSSEDFSAPRIKKENEHGSCGVNGDDQPAFPVSTSLPSYTGSLTHSHNENGLLETQTPLYINNCNVGNLS